MSENLTAKKYPLPAVFDLQSHRGGRGHWTEESAAAFKNSLQLGVTTLELDIVLTKDNVPAVWHDPVLLPEKCSTHQGAIIHELTWDELQKVECAKQLVEFPDAEVIEGNRIIQLKDVFELAEGYNVHFNIETKIEADRPHLSVEPEEFVEAILTAVQDAGVEKQVMIQSFDWRTFLLMKAAAPRIPLVALWDASTWYEGTPWGPYGDIVETAIAHDISVLSPDYRLLDKSLIKRAHKHGMRVVPWTINEPAEMERLIDLGVDGMITDYPKTLKKILGW